MKHPSRWESNTLRRLFIALMYPLLIPAVVVSGAILGIAELVSEFTDSAKKVWKRPN